MIDNEIDKPERRTSKIHPINENIFELEERNNKIKSDSKLLESRIIKESNNDTDEDSDEEADSFGSEKSNDNFLVKVRSKILSAISTTLKKPITKKVLAIILAICYIVYFSYAMSINNPFDIPSSSNGSNSTYILENYVFSNNRGLALFIFTILCFILIVWDLFLAAKLASIKFFQESKFFQNHYVIKYTPWVFIIIALIGIVIYLIVEIKDLKNFISLIGLFVFILMAILISYNPSKINWRTLSSGILFQFLIGLLLIRVEFGYKLFRFFSDQVTTFLLYSNEGSKLVFGEKYADHFFAFSAMPVVIFFGSIVNLLFYFGVIQYLVLKVSYLITTIMNTSPTESLNSTANVFLGMSEAPLLIKPFLPSMTKSEIFAVMSGGFATVAGSTLVGYLGFGIPANHLISASFMASPGALAISKTIFPETKETKADWKAIKNLPKSEAKNFFEAMSIGATNMIQVVAAIVANLIAFTSFFALIDAVFKWFFSMVGLIDFGLIRLMEYLFWPFALIMGVTIEDCQTVSRLIGTKIFVNEFVAYDQLGGIIRFRDQIIANNTFNLYYNGTIDLNREMIWNDRSIRIATYALCGFANFASIGMQIGCMSALAPSRSKLFTKYATRAMIAGNLTNFISACISGLLYENF